MITKVSGKPSVTITGTDFSANVPLAAYDDYGWIISSTTVTVTGVLTDTEAKFMVDLKAKAEIWKQSLAVKDSLNGKLSRIEGKTL